MPDRSFDSSVSIFGSMFAPGPFDVARELVRVTKPSGRIVMGNWIPNDATSFVSQLLKIGASFQPPPPEGFISPMLWGVQSNILERFGKAGIAPEKISMVRDTYLFTRPDGTPERFIRDFETFSGPTMNALAAAQQSGRGEEFHRQLLELAKTENKAAGGGVAISATFMRVTVSL